MPPPSSKRRTEPPCFLSLSLVRRIEDAPLTLLTVAGIFIFPKQIKWRWLIPPLYSESKLKASISLLIHSKVYKILQCVESYQMEHKLHPMPIILCSDWNGSKQGHVYKFLRSWGFVSSYDGAHQYSDNDVYAHKWVSHRNHCGNIYRVDFIWLLNPSNKLGKPLRTSWNEAVLGIIKVKFPQGIEMLNIFKNYSANTCILDDFGFYESRKKAMLDKRIKLTINESDNLKLKNEATLKFTKPSELKAILLGVQLLDSDKPGINHHGKCTRFWLIDIAISWKDKSATILANGALNSLLIGWGLPMSGT